MAKSKVAAEARAAQIEAIRRLTPEERVRRVMEARELGLQLYMAGMGVSRDEAVRAIKRSREAGRRRS
jgi:hypothetical protein